MDVDIDYLDLDQVDSVTTVEGYQFEKYRNKRNGGFDYLLREDRFGKVLAYGKDLQEADVDQIMVDALDEDRDYDIKEVLNGDR